MSELVLNEFLVSRQEVMNYFLKALYFWATLLIDVSFSAGENSFVLVYISDTGHARALIFTVDTYLDEPNKSSPKGM